jgi:prepilin-type N-terminal cleavage/methylation domain-containing protein
VTANHKSKITNHKSRSRGLSLVELLIALAISAMLLTATMVAIDASFQAYAAAAETASTQTATRMVVNRLLTLIRTSTAHAPLLDDPTDTPPVVLLADGQTIESYYLTLLNAQGDLIRIEYRDSTHLTTPNELWMIMDPAGGGTQVQQPIMGGVTDCKFYTHRRTDNAGVLVLERGSIDMTVVADEDNSLAIEGAELPPIRVIASTMPRKLR